VLIRRLTKRERERMRVSLQSITLIEPLMRDLLFRD
jgi:hypothetical protein